jgi:regulator of RNase E activity RraA
MQRDVRDARFARFNFKQFAITAGLLIVLALTIGTVVPAQTPAKPAQEPAPVVNVNDPKELIAAFRKVEAASVADAEEQLYGKKMYMSHHMRPIAPSHFAGYALTVLLKKEEHKEGSAAQQGMLTAIDEGAPDSVYVMVVENGDDIAGIGALMGMTMSVRGFAGAVIDGGVRDIQHLNRIGFPVFARGIVPSTSVNHYRFAGSNIPVTCDGVPVNPNDIIVADNDGVVVVPRANAAEVLAKAQALDFTEHSMYPFIEKYRSIVKAVAAFGRI